MTDKEIVKAYWEQFEVLAFRAVKKKLPHDFIVEETLTKSVKDGGYDGEFILGSQDGTVSQVLVEAKLRSHPKDALPLNDFAKALVIAIVRQADTMYIVTNLRFSAETMKLLNNYASSASLSIQLLNGMSVKKFIKSHCELLQDIHADLQHFLLSQNHVLEEQTLPSAPPPWSTFQPEQEYMVQARNLLRKKGVLCVEGRVGSGKSYYIENLCRAVAAEKKQVFSIDLSKCLTYKDLFLQIMEKTLGLSLELVDLVDPHSFAESFSRIGNYTSNEDDIKMLQFIFSRSEEYPYDYSILFSQITSFYVRLCPPVKKRGAVVAFLNLAYAQRETLQLLLYFLNHQVPFSSILEVSKDYFDREVCADWQSIRGRLMHLSTFESHVVEDWDVEDAERFLRKHVPGISEDQIDSLIRQFGCTPAELSHLVEMIDYSALYEETPRELIFQAIAALKIKKNDSLYQMCYEYMQYANSDAIYIYTFLVLLSGEIRYDALEDFFHDSARLASIISFVRKSSLFIVEGGNVAIKNMQAQEYLQAYCEAILSPWIVKTVFGFIERHQENFHLSLQARLEMACQVNFYRNPEAYVESLANLGDRYLELGQMPRAEIQYRKAYNAIKKYRQLLLSSLTELRIRLGLAATLIWNVGSSNVEIQRQFDFIEAFSPSALDDPKQYQCLKLRYYLLCYQFHHIQEHRTQAFKFSKKGVEWAETHNLYQTVPNDCGKMWRFYAIAVKEITQDIEKCLDVFEQGFQKCQNSAQFLFGYVIHKNMVINTADPQKRISQKLRNYELLSEREWELSIDEYLHFKVNVAALYFLKKDYKTSLAQYIPLIEKSAVFNIIREEVRILNDMANLCWICGDLDEAQKKYCRGKELAKSSGYTRTYWKILINLMSFELAVGRDFQAAALYQELLPHLEQLCSDLQVTGLSFERREYYTAALTVCLKNLWKLHQSHPDGQFFSAAEQLLRISGIGTSKSDQPDGVDSAIRQMSLKGTIFEHNGLYLLKA